MSDLPLVSIIIPCYNQGQYLADAVHSILQQTYHHWECIIVNDGSTDNTKVVAKSFAELDSRIIYVEKSNGGLSTARNAGLKRCVGEYIQFLDADDVLESEKLDLSIKAITNKPNSNLILTDFYTTYIGTEEKLEPYCNLSSISLKFESFLLEWDKSFSIPIHCALFSAKLIKPIGFVETLKAKEDWIMWLYVSRSITDYAFINKKLVGYRHHKESMSLNRIYMLSPTADAFDFITKNLVDEKQMIEFSLKINSFWKQEIVFLKSQIIELRRQQDQIVNSSSYRIAGFILTPIKLVKKIIG